MQGVTLTSPLSNRELENVFVENHKVGSEMDLDWIERNEAIVQLAERYGLDPSVSIVRAFLTSVLIETIPLTFVCDDRRHLVCLPFSVNNLHKMAQKLNIDRCWFHSSTTKPHYDIPKKRVAEIQEKCVITSSKNIVQIILGKITLKQQL